MTQEIEYETRDFLIAGDYGDRKGTLKELGEKYGVTGPRIRQIWCRMQRRFGVGPTQHFDAGYYGEEPLRLVKAKPRDYYPMGHDAPQFKNDEMLIDAEKAKKLYAYLEHFK